MYKKDLVHKIFDWFPKLSYKEDVAFLYKMMILAESFGIVEDTWYYYRKNATSVTTKADKDLHSYYIDSVNASVDVLNLLNQIDITEEKYNYFFNLYIKGRLNNILKAVSKIEFYSELDNLVKMCELKHKFQKRT